MIPKTNKEIFFLGKRQQNKDGTYGCMSTPWNIMLKEIMWQFLEPGMLSVHFHQKVFNKKEHHNEREKKLQKFRS
jgi:hypothetical protein